MWILDDLAGRTPVVCDGDGAWKLSGATVEYFRGGVVFASVTVLVDDDGLLDWMVVRDCRNGAELHLPGRALDGVGGAGALAGSLSGLLGFALPGDDQ